MSRIMPRFSVIIPWANWPGLDICLAKNRPFFEANDAETIIINAGGDRDKLAAILEQADLPGVVSVELADAPFNKTVCQNIGVSISRADYLLTLDADTYMCSDILREAVPYLERGDSFVTLRRFFETDASAADETEAKEWSFLAELLETKELTTLDGRRAVLRQRSLAGARGGDGFVLVRKDHMLRVGGLNGALVGWGFEDTDFQIRLQFALGLERIDLGDVMHVTHSGEGRTHETRRRNMLFCLGRYGGGNYLGTLDEDIRRWRGSLIEHPVSHSPVS